MTSQASGENPEIPLFQDFPLHVFLLPFCIYLRNTCTHYANFCLPVLLCRRYHSCLIGKYFSPTQCHIFTCMIHGVLVLDFTRLQKEWVDHSNVFPDEYKKVTFLFCFVIHLRQSYTFDSGHQLWLQIWSEMIIKRKILHLKKKKRTFSTLKKKKKKTNLSANDIDGMQLKPRHQRVLHGKRQQLQYSKTCHTRTLHAWYTIKCPWLTRCPPMRDFSYSNSWYQFCHCFKCFLTFIYTTTYYLWNVWFTLFFWSLPSSCINWGYLRPSSLKLPWYP